MAIIIALAYGLALFAVACGIVLRGVTPTRFLFWSGLCDLTGFLIVTALLGWAVHCVRQFRGIQRPSPRWFVVAHALLFVFCTLLAIWVSLDFSFDGMGKDIALLGLAGRRAGCPASLMLLGTAILMAWQTGGVTRRPLAVRRVCGSRPIHEFGGMVRNRCERGRRISGGHLGLRTARRC